MQREVRQAITAVVGPVGIRLHRKTTVGIVGWAGIGNCRWPAVVEVPAAAIVVGSSRLGGRTFGIGTGTEVLGVCCWRFGSDRIDFAVDSDN